ncbi:uncharacterized protein LOC130015554 [Mercurialis annua]|uniref:uncharacterized protein LOC130015554 n=1 Tax=Mercurialis annua TaxID=3986 RepID=UPI0024AD8124|nr:uncharacterized protein LOC130015554 [Mercurialis annua]
METFTREDATKIVSIPLPYWPHADKLIWHYTPDGNYAVKSGYYIALHKGFREYQSLNPHLSKNDWKLLWNLKIPNKIKIFIWRCLYDGLPTGAALCHRLQIPSDCKFYGEHETLMHLLFLCPVARQIWFQSPLNFRSSWGVTSNFASHWNNRIFQDAQPSTPDTIQLILEDVEEFQQSQVTLDTTSRCISHVQQRQLNIRGTPPGFLKLNYDAAVNIQQKHGFVGIVAKDDQGLPKGNFFAIFQFIWDPGILEMLALREAMNWAVSRGWTRVLFEGDALQVSNIVNSRRCVVASLHGICQDIWHLQNSFAEVSFLYVPRIQNSYAHR